MYTLDDSAQFSTIGVHIIAISLVIVLNNVQVIIEMTKIIISNIRKLVAINRNHLCVQDM